MKFSDRIFGYFLILLIFFNYIDAFATLYWTSEGYATEINPIMSNWLQINNKAFLFIKIFIVLVASFFLWHVRQTKLAHILVFLMLLLYISVFIIHCNIAWNVFVV
jgi:hypothetical protein